MKPPATACAPVTPPLSKPMPLSSVLASITRSNAALTSPPKAASAAAMPSSYTVCAHCSAMAWAATVGRPPSTERPAGLRLQVRGLITGRQRVAHARHQVADRRSRDQLRVNQYQRRAVREKLAALDDALVRVEDRQRGAGRVGGRDRGADHRRHFQARGDTLARVEAFAAADRDQAVKGDIARPQAGRSALDLAEAALAFEDLEGRLAVHRAQAGQQLLTVTPQPARADQHRRPPLLGTSARKWPSSSSNPGPCT